MSIDIKTIGKNGTSITFTGTPTLYHPYGVAFANLNKRDKSKVFGRNDDYLESKGTVLAEDVLHGLGCDMFGRTSYKISIQITPVEEKNVKQKKTREKEKT
tara:strand:- start:494 stop:796 length:303 start_codon:yes stop_codon:yes gene_type:complete